MIAGPQTPGAAVLLLLLSCPCSVDAAVINRRIIDIGKSSQEVGPMTTAAKEAAGGKSSQEVGAMTFAAIDAAGVHAQLQKTTYMGILDKGSKTGIMQDGAKTVQEVWLVPTAGQKFLFAGTFVYIIFGFAIAYCYYQARLKDEKVFVPRPEPGVFPRTTGFSYDLFSCLSDPKICVMGFCCPCLRWADTLDKQDIMSFGPAFLIMFILSLLSFHTQGIMGVGVVLVGVMARQKLRKKYDMDRSFSRVISDCAVWLCCQPCAIIQEAREESVQRAGV